MSDLWGYERKTFPQLKDVIPISNGVFSHMSYTFRANVDKGQLDFLLMSSFARRNPAPVIDLIHPDDEPDEMLTDAQLSALAELMLGYYKNRWDKLGEIYDIEYDPIHNYLDQWEDTMDQTMGENVSDDSDIVDTLGSTVTRDLTRTDNLSQLETRDLENGNTRTFADTEETTYGKTDTRTDNYDETTTYGRVSEREDDLTKNNTGTQGTVGSDNNTNSVWGFNSNNAVNSDSSSGGNSSTRTDALTEKNTGTETTTLSGDDVVSHDGTQTHALSGTDELEHTGTITDAGTDEGTVTTTNTGTQSDSGTIATTGTNRREVERDVDRDVTTARDRSGKHFGNIGNLTSQKMIHEEIELWKWNYIQSILEDARDFLTLPVYL